MTKRLARSLWRTKLRLYSVVLMIAVGVFAGISFGTYANSTQTLYDNIYGDDEDGVNLPDIWVENSAATWTELPPPRSARPSPSNGPMPRCLWRTVSPEWSSTD